MEELPREKKPLVKYVFCCFLTHFLLPQVACYKQNLPEFHGGFHGFVWKSLRCRLFTCLACSALVPTWRWRWPKKRKERGKTWDDSVGALKMLRKIGDFFHEVSRWTYIMFFSFIYIYQFGIMGCDNFEVFFWPMIQYGRQSFWAIDIPFFGPQDGESTWCWNWEQLHTHWVNYIRWASFGHVVIKTWSLSYRCWHHIHTVHTYQACPGGPVKCPATLAQWKRWWKVRWFFVSSSVLKVVHVWWHVEEWQR